MAHPGDLQPAACVSRQQLPFSTAVLLPRLLGELALEHADDRSALRAVIAAFVALIEDEPELYRFAYAQAGRSGRADLVAATEHEIAEALAAVMTARLAEAGRPTGAARTVPAPELVEQLTALADGGLTTLLPPRRG